MFEMIAELYKAFKALPAAHVCLGLLAVIGFVLLVDFIQGNRS